MSQTDLLKTPTLLVLAAGMGSRYKGLKQLDGIGPANQTIIDYTLYDAIAVGFRKVVFVIRKAFESDFRRLFSDKVQSLIKVEFVFQELEHLPAGLQVPKGRQKPWGTGHAILLSESVINESFVTVNADDYYGRSALRLMFNHMHRISGQTNGICMAGYQLNKTLSPNGGVSRGICQIDEYNNLLGIEEALEIEANSTDEIAGFINGSVTPFNGTEIVSMNLIGMTPDIFSALESGFMKFYSKNHLNIKAEYYIPDFINSRLKLHPVTVLPTTDEWFGVTYQSDKSFVRARLEVLTSEGHYPAVLWN